MIINNLIKFITAFAFIIVLFFQEPTFALDKTSQYKIISPNNSLFAALKYEAKEPTSLENPVTDPNFNVMRNKELGKATAIPLVVGILVIAIAAPIATWIYFSN